ncbi:MAG: SAM-dependent methyltransferase [Kiritimatiellia bacterium]|jgi:SAM-dependent methyltransferase
MNEPSPEVAALVDLLASCSPNGPDFPIDHPILRELQIPNPPPAIHPVGAVYTPRALVDRSLAPLPWPKDQQLRIADLACGAGAFLVGTVRRMGATPAQRAYSLRHIFGYDTCPRAVAITRMALTLAVLEVSPRPWSPIIRLRAQKIMASVQVKQVDSLFDLHDTTPFDTVIGNPPWEDAAAMCRRAPAWRALVAERYASAKGNWDLYCPFVELALDLLVPGGHLSLVLPDKIAQAEYASTVRGLMQPHLTSLHRLDSTDFNAAINPVLLQAQKGPDAVGDTAAWLLDDAPAVPQSWSPLGEWCQIFGAATVGEAYAFQALITDQPKPSDDDLRLVNTGTIDPFVHLWGRRPLRYLGRRLLHPVITANSTSEMPPKRLAQARTAKVIVAGLTKRLEAVADSEGALLPGKSTVVVVPPPGVSPDALCALLCAPCVTRMWRQQYSALALQNGYLRVGPPQLRGLSLPILTPDSPLTERLGQLARRGKTEGIAAIETLLDEAIWQMHDMAA